MTEDPRVIPEALAELRNEIRSRVDANPAGAQAIPEMEWLEIFEQMRKRFNTLGVIERSGELDEFGLDPIAVAGTASVFDLLMDPYWRIAVSGSEKIPDSGPILFVANRSGVLPYDALMIAHAAHRLRPEAGRVRFLITRELVPVPFVQAVMTPLGGLPCSYENANRLLQRGHRVVGFPEGSAAGGRLFRERYRLKEFNALDPIRAAQELGVPVLPVAILGPEEAHPLIHRAEALGKQFGVPYLPVTPTFPVLGPLGALPVPTRWSIQFDDPIEVRELGSDAELLRERLRSLLESGLEKRTSVWR